jgi:tetratricopeptide (TPR) repeat protein
VAALLDDAAGPAQVRALLPGSGLVLVTSRRQMPGLAASDGALLIRLGPLDPPSAAELARRIAARPRAAPGDLEDLARLCGLLPLTIRAASARLAARPRLPITQVTAELAATRDKLYLLDNQEGTIRAVMDTSYEALDSRAARAYRLLSLAPGPDFTAGAAAALLDTITAEAEELVEVLAAASLLEETAPGRWTFHDLTRDHARHQADAAESAGERNAAMARGIDWYLRAAAAADLVVLPGRMRTAPAFALPRQRPPAWGEPDEALAWFDTEARNLMASQKLAASLGLHTLAWQYVDVMWGWLGHHQVFDAWRGVCEEAITAARACGDARAESWAGSRLACCHVSAGDPAAAVTAADAAISVAYRAGDRAGEASAQEQRGNAALAAGHHDEAIRCYQRGLACWNHITEHTRATAILHRQLGRAHAQSGDIPQAEEHLVTARDTFRDLGETYHEARTLYALAGIRLETGQAAESAALLREAQPLMEQAGHVLSLSELLTRLAQASIATGDTGQARACLDRAAELQASLGLPGSHPARTWTSRTASQLAAGAEPPGTGD